MDLGLDFEDTIIESVVKFFGTFRLVLLTRFFAPLPTMTPSTRAVCNWLPKLSYIFHLSTAVTGPLYRCSILHLLSSDPVNRFWWNLPVLQWKAEDLHFRHLHLLTGKSSEKNISTEFSNLFWPVFVGIPNQNNAWIEGRLPTTAKLLLWYLQIFSSNWMDFFRGNT